MTGNNARLTVFFQDKQIGHLEFIENNQCQFSYTDEWLMSATAFAISPHIPLAAKVDSQTIIHFIRNLFPEGTLFDSLLENLGTSKHNIYGILKAIGHDTQGALTFGNPILKTEPLLRKITESELIQKLDTQSIQELVMWDGKYRLSVAGVQRKLNILVKDSAFFLAEGDYSSTHILKFSKPQQNHLIINELICMRLADAINMTVPEVCFKQFGQHSALLVTRFDRKLTDHQVLKRHVIDGCQILNKPPDYKYEQNYGSSPDVQHIREGINITELFKLSDLMYIPIQYKDSLMDWVLFNLIIGNSDAHGKNISFFISHQGMRLSPFYDLVSIAYEAVQNPHIDTQLAMAIGDNFDLETLKAYDLLSFAENIDFPLSQIAKRLSKILNKIETILNNNDDFYIKKEDDNINKAMQTHGNHIIALIKKRVRYFRKEVIECPYVIEMLFK